MITTKRYNILWDEVTRLRTEIYAKFKSSSLTSGDILKYDQKIDDLFVELDKNHRLACVALMMGKLRGCRSLLRHVENNKKA